MSNPPARRTRRAIASAGYHGKVVSIVARDDHPTHAMAQWRSASTGKRERRRIGNVTLTAEGTPVSLEQRTELQKLAILLHSRLDDAQPMPGEPGCPSWGALLKLVRPKPANEPDVGAKVPVTVREALAVAYGASYASHRNKHGRISGRHIHKIKGTSTGAAAISTWSREARDLRRTADLIEELLGPDEAWNCSKATYNRLRDALIVRARKEAGGVLEAKKFRRVHKALQAYIRAMRLVYDASEEAAVLRNRVVPAPLTIERWQTDLKKAWVQHGLSLAGRRQPRYDQFEAGMIYVEGTSGAHDPRYGLWLELGIAGRPSQVLRTVRSQLEPRSSELPGGEFRGPSANLKHGLAYALTPAHRNRVEAYLRGYLAEYEARYQAREILDYPLFPAAAPIDGVIPFQRAPRAWSYRQFLGEPTQDTGFYAIERAAGVNNIPGRGPYGLKYLIADLAPTIAGTLGVVDAVAINFVTAHDTPGTAPVYRLEPREQNPILLNVGKITWGILKHLRQKGHEGKVRSLVGDSTVDGERIGGYQVRPDGVMLRLVSGGGLWVPWIALRKAGESAKGVDLLIAHREPRESHDLDDDARSITFLTTAAPVVLRVGVLHDRAAQNIEFSPDDATLVSATPGC